MNSVFFSGRITKDLELRQTASGKSCLQFSLAVDRPWISGNEKQSDFFNIVAWGKTAENVSRFCQKGSKVLVSGFVYNRSWEKDGRKHFVTEINADRVEFLDSKNKESAALGAPISDLDVPF